MKEICLLEGLHTGIIWIAPASDLHFSKYFFKNFPQSLAKTVSHSLRGSERGNHRFRGCEEGEDQ
jgi:hypothetical protein